MYCGKEEEACGKEKCRLSTTHITHARNFDRYTRHPHSAMFLLLLQADFVLIRYFIYVYIIFRSSAFPRYSLAILHFIETHTKRREKKNRRRLTHLEHTHTYKPHTAESEEIQHDGMRCCIKCDKRGDTERSKSAELYSKSGSNMGYCRDI